MQITFDHPWHLLFMLSIPLMIYLHLYSRNFVKRRAFKFANFEAIKRAGVGIHGGHILSRNYTQFGIRMAVVFFLILSASGMVVWYQGTSGAVDFVIAIDASGSMLAKDFDPNRLAAAKSAAIEFLESLPSRTSLAVVSFGGATFIKKEMSPGIEQAMAAVSNIGLASAEGTAIGEAIIGSVNLFGDMERARMIVLLTDGQNTVGTDIGSAVEYAKQKHVTIHTIGMATAAGAQFEGLTAVSRLDEATLKDIAEETGGTFYRAENYEQLAKSYSQISQSSERSIPVRLTTPFIILSIFLIIGEWLLSSLRYPVIP